MKVLLLVLITVMVSSFQAPAFAASHPNEDRSMITAYQKPSLLPGTSYIQLRKGIKPSIHGKRLGWKVKLASKMMKWKFMRKWIGMDQPTERQRKLGKISLYLAIGAALLLLVPPLAAATIPAVIGLLSLPMSIISLILGIKSIKGNSNAMGLIGLAVSGTILVIYLLGIILFTILLTGDWWF